MVRATRLELEQYQLNIDDIVVNVVRKHIKSLRLTVDRFDGQVRMSAPLVVHDSVVREFVRAKSDWIRCQLQAIHETCGPLPRQYAPGDAVHYLGRRYTLGVTECTSPRVVLGNQTIDLFTRKGSDSVDREKILYQWYRERLRTLMFPLVRHWEPVLGVSVHEVRIKKMKTRWGTCNVKASRIWLNLELAKRSEGCIEYVIVHEMIHLLEPSHNKRFVGFMDQFLPDWSERKSELGVIV